MAHYLDSSALVKRYIAEAGSAWVNQICRSQPSFNLYTVRLSGAEIVAAIYARMRSGAIVLSDAQAAAYQFRADFQQHYGVIEVTDVLIDTAMSLAEKHALRGYDSVQLAAALSLQQVRASLSLPTLIFGHGLSSEKPSLQMSAELSC